MQLTRLINDYLSQSLSERLTPWADITDGEEIRIRIGQPLYIRRGGKREYIGGSKEGAYCPTSEDISATLNKMSSYSLYAFNDEIKKGYLTLPGGYRVGISGSVVYSGGEISTIKNISSLNIRISRQVKGCADKVIKALYPKGKFLSTLIVSPPACGKTTLLRDMIRQLSDGGACVGLADERSEVAGSYMGQAQTDVGSHTDILDGCAKAEGMYMLLRSMGPRIIAADEIGSPRELSVIRQIVNSGVGLLCTVHSGSIKELKSKPGFGEIISGGVFKYYIILSSSPRAGTVEQLLDGELNSLCF